PPLLGFIGKELIYETLLSSHVSYLVIAIVVLSNACMVGIAGLIALRCFFHKPIAGHHLSQKTTRQDPVFRMWAGPMVLAISGLLFGLMPGLVQALLEQAASTVQGRSVHYTLSLWHGLTPMLTLSILTLIL